MSSPGRSDPSRSWWSLSSKHSGKDLTTSNTPDKHASTGTKFNSIASAIGLKSKKQPALTIQDPPIRSSPPSPDPSTSQNYTNRPPSKSVSSTWSRVDSIEPRTPLDGQPDTAARRHSLLTLSDNDPFASRGIAAPTSPIDRNRLSAYSGNSVPEYISKKLEDAPVSRISYASSSSNSHLYSDEMASLSPTSSIYATAEKPRRMLSHKKSFGDVSLKSGRLKLDDNSSRMKSNSAVTLTDKNRLSHPDLAPAPRPPMRARGLTDAAATTYHRPRFLQSDFGPPPKSSPSTLVSPSITSPMSPRVVIRQPSVQRMGLPVSAPPATELPPPPSPIDDGDVDPLRFSNSASSASASFRSSKDVGMINKHYTPHSKPRERGALPVEDLTEHSYKPRTLKKAVSQQSLSKAASSSSTSVVAPPETVPEGKVPRKQRSFHHPRFPPIPLSLKHQSSPSGSAGTFSDLTESKRTSTGPPTPGRKRLFSGSSMRRPSTSQETFANDDSRSIFSFEREKPALISTKSSFSTSKPSFWDESYAETAPSSPQALTPDYTPQQIMSPAEMLKVEADVRESLPYSRSRGMSTVSVSTMASQSTTSSHRSGLLSPQLPPHLMRSNSLSGGSIAVPKLPRPSTADPSTSLSSNHTLPDFVSLPPPPRPRRSRPTLNTTPVVSEAPLKGLSPVPRTRVVAKKPSSEKMNRRIPLTRKSSFLDIDDDSTSQNLLSPRPPLVPPPPQEASFLDLARSSLDTVQSDFEPF